jgi:hypothetical protein
MSNRIELIINKNCKNIFFILYSSTKINLIYILDSQRTKEINSLEKNQTGSNIVSNQEIIIPEAIVGTSSSGVKKKRVPK